MLIANNITMQFGSKPLFEDVSVKFGDGNRYGLIGAYISLLGQGNLIFILHFKGRQKTNKRITENIYLFLL